MSNSEYHPQSRRVHRVFLAKNSRRGFFQLLSLFLIFSASMWYFGIDVRGFVDTHLGLKSFFSAGREFFSWLAAYVSKLFTLLWGSVIMDYSWEHAVSLAAHARAWLPENLFNSIEH